MSDLYRTCSGRLYKGSVSVDKKICQFLLLANLNGIAQTKYENKVKEKFEATNRSKTDNTMAKETNNDLQNI